MSYFFKKCHIVMSYSYDVHASKVPIVSYNSYTQKIHNTQILFHIRIHKHSNLTVFNPNSPKTKTNETTNPT